MGHLESGRTLRLKRRRRRRASPFWMSLFFATFINLWEAGGMMSGRQGLSDWSGDYLFQQRFESKPGVLPLVFTVSDTGHFTTPAN